MGHSPLGTHWCRHMLCMRQAEHGEKGATRRSLNYTHAGRGGGACAPPPPWSDRRQAGPAHSATKRDTPSCPANLTSHPQLPNVAPSAHVPWHTQRMVMQPSQSRAAYAKTSPQLRLQAASLVAPQRAPHPHHSYTQRSDLPASRRSAPNAAQALARSRSCTRGAPPLLPVTPSPLNTSQVAHMHSSSRPGIPCQHRGLHARMRAPSAATCVCCRRRRITRNAAHTLTGPSAPDLPTRTTQRENTPVYPALTKLQQAGKSAGQEAELKYFRLIIADTGKQGARTCSSICSSTNCGKVTHGRR